MKYRKTAIHNGEDFTATIERRTSRRGKEFWIIMYYSQCTGTEGYIHIEDGWQDADRTYTAQDIYWTDKYDEQAGQRKAA